MEVFTMVRFILNILKSRKFGAALVIAAVLTGCPGNIDEHNDIDGNLDVGTQSTGGSELRSLRYDGVILMLQPGVFNYTVMLSSRHRSSAVPELEWTVNSASDTVTLVPVSSIPGTVFIHVDNADNIRSTYGIRFERSGNPEEISRTTSWVGNSFPGTGNAAASWPNADGGWVQNWVLAFYVGADGALYTASQWDEGGRQNGVYRSGVNGGYAAGTHSVNVTQVQIIDGSGNRETGGPPGGPQDREIMRIERNAMIDGRVVEMDPAIATVNTDRTSHTLASNATLVENRTAWIIDGSRVVQQDQIVTRTPGNLIVWGSTNRNGHTKHINVTAERGTITLPNNGEPGAVAIANHDPNILIIADNRNGHILLYDVTNPNTPSLTETFGSGYLTAHSSGSPSGDITDPKKFWDIVGVGTDSTGNLYVAQSNRNTLLKAFRPNRDFWWQLEGFAFVDVFDFDPATNGSDIYGMTTRYTATDSNVPGQDYQLVSYTMDLQAYPHDPRNMFKTRSGHPVSSVTMRRINGQRYMFITGMHYGRLYMYRFDGEIAVPYAVITDQRQTLGFYEQEWMYLNNESPIPNQPTNNVSYIWTDTNGNGQFDQGEFSTLPGSQSRLNTGSSHSWTVDHNGDIWIVLNSTNNGMGGRGILQLKVNTSGSHPVYSWADSVRYSLPAEYSEVRRVQYDTENDVMYLMGHTTDYPADSGAWGSGGRVITRYNNWKANHTAEGTRTSTHIHAGFPVILSYFIAQSSGHGQSNITASTLHFAGDRLFVIFGSRGSLGFTGGELHVYDTQTGRNLGTLTPGEIVGGHTNVGLIDIPEAVRAIKLNETDANGNHLYKVLVEEDYFAKNLLYTMNSNPSGIINPSLSVSLTR